MKVIFSKFMHPKETCNSINVTDDGIIICTNDEHLAKEDFLISVSEERMEICVNDVHLEKVESPISVTGRN